MTHPAQRTPPRRHPRAFTFAELTAALAILVIVVLGARSVARANRAAARTLACQSHLRLLGIAMHAYADGENGYLPPHSRENRKIPWFANERYRTLLRLDPKSRNVPADILCPERPHNRQSITNVYGQNATGVPVTTEPAGPAIYLQLTPIDLPATKVLLHDANDWSTRSTGADDQTGWNKSGEKLTSEGGRSGLTAYRHAETANVLHADLGLRTYTKAQLCPRGANGAPSRPGLDRLWRLYKPARRVVQPAATPPAPTSTR